MNRRELLIKSTVSLAGYSALPSLSLVLQNCNVKPEGDYEPRYLSLSMFHTVRLIAEIMLPRTDTPGAEDVGVAPFIDLLTGEFFSVNEKKRFEEGLQEFMDSTEKNFNMPFFDLEPEKRLSLMEQLDAEASAGSFIRSVKGLVMWGYYTSEEGMNSMNYQPVPGKYQGCIDADDTTRLLVGNR